MKSEERMYRFIEDKQIEKIVLEYILNNNLMEDRCIDVIKVAFDQMISRILLQIKLYIENTNQFKKTENLYNVVQDVKKRYTNYLNQNISQDEEQENIRIIHMIFDVLENQIEEIPIERENPLEYERTLIESLALLKAQDALNRLRDKSITNFKLPLSIYNNYREIIKTFIFEAYCSMQEDLKNIVEVHAKEINIYENRLELLEYVKTVKEQKTVLENYIHIDLNIDGDRLNEESNHLTRQFIYPLREIYQYICSAIEDVEHAKKKSEDIVYKFTIQNIDAIIENNILNNSKLSALMEVVEMNKNNTIDLFLMHLNDELVKVSTKAVNHLKRMSHPFELISFSIIDLIGTTLMEVQLMDIESVHEQHHLSIIRGVIDTLMLKYDIIKEKNEDFQLERKTGQLEMTNMILEFREEFEDKCDAYFEEALQGKTSGFIYVQERFEKVINQSFEQAYEKELNYLTRDVLFEIKSFEEMIYQSIAILMKSEEESVLLFGNKMHYLFDIMIKILKKHKVERIFPQPGEKFNGKAHEIIFVEESSDFNKGEIIRTQNSGFVIEERVISRASVVAAK